MAAGELVAGAHTGEDAIDEADFGGGSRDEGTHLGHDDEESVLADVGGFTGHVGAGEDDDLVVGGVEVRVVRDELVIREEAFDDGVAAGSNADSVGIIDDGTAVIAAEGDPGKVLEDVKGGDSVSEVEE